MEQGRGNQRVTPWSPLGQPVFRALWLAAVTSNIGTLMQNVGAAWLMTILSNSPLMVSLVQTSTTLPMFLLALPAGALADVIDRRKVLLFTQTWMLAAAAGLGIITLAGLTTPGLLLVLTFALGAGAALNAPSWQAIIPELVSGPQLLSAVALNSAGFNVARAIGPALGGLVVAAAGAGIVFLLNAASFLGVIAVLFSWKRRPHESLSPAEGMREALWAGVRYVRYTPALRALFLRAAIFAFFAAPLLALLPLFARQELSVGSAGYGVLLGAFGIGAVLGALILPALRHKLSPDFSIHAGALVFAGMLVAIGQFRNFVLANLFMLVAGGAWLVVLSIFNTTVQVIVPSWVRGRALASYLLIFFGGMAAGSFLWGAVAEFAGIPRTLFGTAAGLVVGFLLAYRFRLVVREEDLRPSRHWPEHNRAEPDPERGPVLMTVEYRIDPKNSGDFIGELRELGRLRRRDGAMNWRAFQDPAVPGRYMETFMVASWAEHLRQHERITAADRLIEQRVRSFHLGPEPPSVSHFVSISA